MREDNVIPMPDSAGDEPRSGVNAARNNLSAPLSTPLDFDWALIPLILGLFGAFFFNPAAEGVSAGWALAALVFGALGALAFCRDPFAADHHTRIGLGLIAALATWMLITRLWALNPGGSMLEAARLATFVLLVWAARASLTKATSRWILLTALGALSLKVALPDFWRILTEGAPAERTIGELGYWNATAIVSLALIPLAAAVARSAHRVIGVAVAALLVPISASSAAATASRGAMLALLTALIILVFASSDRRRWIGVSLAVGTGAILTITLLAQPQIPSIVSLTAAAVFTAIILWPATRRAGSIRQDTRAQRGRRMSVFGVVLCVIIAALVAGLLVDQVGTRSAAPTDNHTVERLVQSGDSMRGEWWRETLTLWKEAPVFGQGGQAFELSRAWRLNDFASHPHSLVLQMLLETGILGLSIALVASLLILRATLGAPRSPERAVASAIVVMFLFQAAIDWTWSLPQVMTFIAVALAILLPGRSRSDYPVAAPLTTPPLRVVLATLAVIIVLTPLALIPGLSGLLADQAAQDIDDGKTRRAVVRAEWSQRLLPSYPTLQLQVIALEVLGQHEEVRSTLKQAEKIWWPLPNGIEFARDRFDADSDYAVKLDNRLEELEQLRATEKEF